MSDLSANLAPYACDPSKTRGRLVDEPESPTRSCFQRDRDRVIHSGAFRRLQYKTQVFVYHEGDHFRTRLTHSLEVAQIARSISRTLRLNEDLAEAIALAHDLGHTPFGHAGEDVLGEMMAPFGGFDHNEQTFRIIADLEHRYARFRGLNLTWETLEGVVKHNGPLSGPNAGEKERAKGGAGRFITEFCKGFDLEVDSFAGAEAQVAALADDIAYNNHDIDDGLRAGLFTIEDLHEIPLVGPMFAFVAETYPGIDETSLIHESVRRLIDRMVNDLLEETRRRLESAAPQCSADVRALDHPIVAFSEEMRENERVLRSFLFSRMYRHERVMRMTSEVKVVARDLFRHYQANPSALPDQWRDETGSLDDTGAARLIADYIAGMTDRFAMQEHAKLIG
ncbi:deoxyguanosinetriphosphate triphosphohydrolase [Pelagibius sp. Alg239-R121]|uniref:deoxyguanosinetriphosphate triphosphohydrolase n=1 Tax=Pelagibius sp. Alg239-R121 TaxID=2993448 RepID=UPI0024A60F47|nr:deoxyguanosinetriphosphate triphosphohydrolase [Pelagibius sp. Alg239-R121]